jgi:hypothetical protein
VWLATGTKLRLLGHLCCNKGMEWLVLERRQLLLLLGTNIMDCFKVMVRAGLERLLVLGLGRLGCIAGSMSATTTTTTITTAAAVTTSKEGLGATAARWSTWKKTTGLIRECPNQDTCCLCTA